jgi:UDP-N-acetylglucosamine--N-acetylmuramyl-(pentapeptide) pyrophosphoryl-undecaprenol N-acetylglucosamine transferase
MRKHVHPSSGDGAMTLLVASAGGHLKQLHRLRPRLEELEGDVVWVTWPCAQERSLLRDEPVIHVRETAPRDVVTILRNTDHALAVTRKRQVRTLVSTGSQVVLPFMAMARARGASCHFIESAARSEGPSLTGRLVQRIPGVHYYTQYAGGSHGYVGSVFDGFAAARRELPARISRAVVVLGTMPHGFRRLVERLAPLLGPEVETLWQVGSTDTGGLGIHAHRTVPAHDLAAAMREADVVVAHAGVGAALDAFESGRHPILVPRRVARGEHVDDHQRQVAHALAARGLAMTRDADELSENDLLAAAARAVAEVPAAPVHLDMEPAR